MPHSTATRRRGKGPRPMGLVLYEGPSLINMEPVVVIATPLNRRSKNEKTGRMIGTWILHNDGRTDPLRAMATDKDYAVCGDCPLRGRACYVNVAQAPLGIWRAHQNGSYLPFHPRDHAWLFEGRFVRFGSYGDPAAVPYWVWDVLATHCAGHTGYTHQWAWKGIDPRMKRLVMASCDTPQQRERAIALGWRTFRVMGQNDSLAEGEFLCPASEEAGRRLTCVECRACSGALKGSNASPAIPIHGPRTANRWKHRMFEATQARILEKEGRRMALPLI